MQSALLRTARRWRSARQAPEAYARTVVANLAKDRWRSLGRRRRGAAGTRLTAGVHDGASVDSQLDRDALMRAARTLPPGPAGGAGAPLLRRPVGRGDGEDPRHHDRHRQVTDLACARQPAGRAHHETPRRRTPMLTDEDLIRELEAGFRDESRRPDATPAGCRPRVRSVVPVVRRADRRGGRRSWCFRSSTCRAPTAAPDRARSSPAGSAATTGRPPRRGHLTAAPEVDHRQRRLDGSRSRCPHRARRAPVPCPVAPGATPAASADPVHGLVDSGGRRRDEGVARHRPGDRRQRPSTCRRPDPQRAAAAVRDVLRPAWPQDQLVDLLLHRRPRSPRRRGRARAAAGPPGPPPAPPAR